LPVAPERLHDHGILKHIVECLASDDYRLLTAAIEVVFQLAEHNAFLPGFGLEYVVSMCGHFEHSGLYRLVLDRVLVYCRRKSGFLDEALESKDCITFVELCEDISFNCKVEVAMFVSRLVVLLTQRHVFVIADRPAL
jgi:hypothetical protein